MINKLSKIEIISMLTLDRLDLTKKAVNSILKYTNNKFKIVFCDNGSKEDTLNYLDNLKAEHPSLVDLLKNEENIGVAAGRNKIYRHVIANYGNNFRWILNLDNDCMVHKNYDTSLTGCFEETDAIAVCPKLIQPNGKIFHNAYDGFLINLDEMQLKLEYGDNVNLSHDDPKVSSRMKTDVILGTSAKTPEFLNEIGFYDEGHKIGWEDYSIALRALGLKKEDFLNWKEQNEHQGETWVPLRKLMDSRKDFPDLRIIYEPKCVITHDHPVTEKDHEYEKTRWDPQIIADSTAHFEYTWGLKPIM
jgi:glycosyltransferase involved in cell wall biosynthesis